MTILLVGLLLAFPLTWTTGTKPDLPRTQDRARPGPAGQPEFHRSRAFVKYRRSGREVVVEKSVDLDGDGRQDVLLVGTHGQGLEFSVYRQDEKGRFVRLFADETVPASQVERLELIQLGGEPVVWLDVFEDSPDEADHLVRLFRVRDGQPANLLNERFRIQHPEEEAGRTPVRVVDLGGLAVGLSVEAGTSGKPRLVLNHQPKRLDLRDGQGRPLQVVVGIHQRVYEPSGEGYRQVSDGFVEYLKPLPPETAMASSEAPEAKAGRISDGNPETGWMAAGARAKGESVRLVYREPAPIRALKLSPSCGASSPAVRKFTVSFEGARSIQIDRERVGSAGPLVLAWAEGVLADSGGQVQTLVFLEEAIQSRWLKLKVDEVAPAADAARAVCIGELTAYQAKPTIDHHAD